MDGDKHDTSAKSWKEKWSTLAERGTVLTKGVGSTLTDKGKRISNASREAASKAKDSLEEARQRRLLEKMARDVDEILAEIEQAPADAEEVERLRLLVATLEVRQKEQEALIEEMSKLADEVPDDGEGPAAASEAGDMDGEANIGFVATIRQTYALIGFAVLWALLLVVVTRSIENDALEILGEPADPYVWIIGTMIWAFVVISQISRAGSFDKLPLSFRIQATLGVGVATAATSLLPEIEQMPAMFHIFSWLVIVSLSILLLSSILNGFRSVTG